MDLALVGMKRLKKEGKLADQEESDEINACSIVVPVEVDGEVEEWLVNFKNETHNHPTEIEPFGGAATCLVYLSAITLRILVHDFFAHEFSLIQRICFEIFGSARQFK